MYWLYSIILSVLGLLFWFSDEIKTWLLGFVFATLLPKTMSMVTKKFLNNEINFVHMMEKSPFVIDPHRRLAIMKYSVGGIKYNLHLPFLSREAPKMANRRVTLKLGEKEIDITQQPGIPYLLTPKQLGGIVAVQNLDTDTFVFFTDDTEISLD